MRPLVKMEVDKMTYNVQDDVDSKTSTVLDIEPVFALSPIVLRPKNRNKTK